LNGDLSFLDADADGKLDTGTSITVADDAVATTATGVTVAADMQSVSFTSASPAFALLGTGSVANDRQVAFTISSDGVRVIPATAFTIDAAMAYTDAATLGRSYAAAGISAGAWSLNGDGATISFLPFGDAFSQSVTVTNTGTVDGTISVDWTYNGVTTPTTLTSIAVANSVTDISSELRTMAASAGIVGNAGLAIIVNSPQGQIQIDALYYSKADGDRGVVLTGGANTN
jgi:hypothetical protein